jgi:NAD(P)-dependent dehydrogenase (short-subunit alcohol dehydrogenase family)
VNLTSHFLCSQLFAPALMQTKGCIINIASTRALMSEPNTEPYSASKGGILALTHSLAVTLGPRGVRVNCVSPGWIDTSAWQVKPTPSGLRRRDHRQHPAGRVGRPEDVAAACLFLADPGASGFLTGANLVVDGGMTRKMIYE